MKIKAQTAGRKYVNGEIRLTIELPKGWKATYDRHGGLRANLWEDGVLQISVRREMSGEELLLLKMGPEGRKKLWETLNVKDEGHEEDKKG